MTTPDIFLSYNREDAATARLYADAFAAEGLTVWWDATLRSGEAYDEVTEAALRGAKAVVVLWSPRSVVSRWVRAEATIADRCKTLVPVMIEACERPIMFELTQTAELSHWTGDVGDRAWIAFLRDVRGFVGREVLAPVATALPIPAPTKAATPAPAQPGQKAARPVLAVLPFVNRSGLKEDDIFAFGMVEDIIDALSLSRTIRVLSSGATAAYRKNSADVVEIARQANVRYLLEGNVRRTGDALRVTAQLIDAADGSILWTQKFDRPLSELAELQEELVLEVAAHLGSQISRIELERALKKPGDLNAWEAILRSMASASRGSWAQAITEAERAVALAPDSAVAHATLAFAFSGIGIEGAEYRDKSRAHIARALELDPSNPTVHLWVGWSYCWCQDPEQGLPYLEQAVQARPMNAVARHGLGSALVMLHRNEEALAEWETAERLAPNSPNHYNLCAFIASALVKLGRFEEALARYDQSIRLMPTFPGPVIFRAVVLELLGRNEAAVAAMRQARTIGLEPQGAHALVEGWWRNHPDQTVMRTKLQTLWDASAEVAE